MGNVQAEAASLLMQLVEGTSADPVAHNCENAGRAMRLRNPRENVVPSRFDPAPTHPKNLIVAKNIGFPVVGTMPERAEPGDMPFPQFGVGVGHLIRVATQERS